MFNPSRNKGFWRGVGIVFVGTLVLVSWWVGWFQIIFYVLGLYAAVYIISYSFKTTAVIDFLFSVGGIALYMGSALLGLYLLWTILTIMFTESFFFGLLLLFLLGIFGGFVPMAIGMTLGYPLAFMSEDIEKRFHKVELSQSRPVESMDGE